MKKTNKTTVARKKGGKKCEPVAQVTPPAEKYTMELKMGALNYSSSGNDESIFMGLKPEKITAKCVFVLTNNETNKIFEKALPPMLARKLVVSSLVQKVQWKIMAGKVA